MTTWHYVEDGEWPEEEQDVTISVVNEEKTKAAWLQKWHTGVPGEYVPEKWYYGDGGSLDFHWLEDVYAWAELPEKAPVRETGRSCNCPGRDKVKSLQELCKFCRDEIDYEEDDDMMPGGFND